MTSFKEQIERAQAEIATWSSDRLKNCQLEGYNSYKGVEHDRRTNKQNVSGRIESRSVADW
jgi:hypothetical protein